jgi:hypothetical protein
MTRQDHALSGGTHFHADWCGIPEKLNTGRPIARQAVPTGSDFHCNLRFEVGGVFIDVVNNNAFSGENAAYQIMSETKEWVTALAPIIGAATQAAA